MNTFQIAIMQDDFCFQSAVISVNPIAFEQMSREAIATFITGMVTAKMDHPSASYTKKDKEGNILSVIQRRAKLSAPFEVIISQVVENEETKVIVADEMKFTLTEKSIAKTLLTMPKRLWLMVNKKELVANPLLAFQAPEYYAQQVLR